METSTEALKAALRVLAAALKRLDPIPADVALLKIYAAQFDLDIPTDELARAVVRAVLKERIAEQDGSSVPEMPKGRTA